MAGAGHGPLVEYKKYWDIGLAFKDLQPLKEHGTCEKFNNDTAVKEAHKREMPCFIAKQCCLYSASQILRLRRAQETGGPLNALAEIKKE